MLVNEGTFSYREMQFVPTWDGTMFEALMVSLLVPEAEWAPRSWGTNHPLYVRAQIDRVERNVAPAEREVRSARRVKARREERYSRAPTAKPARAARSQSASAPGTE